MTERFRCAAASRDRDEDLAGTASTARWWLAVEQPGPWGADALLASRMDLDVARSLERLGRAQGMRVVLIRRPGRSDDDGPRTALVADTGGTQDELGVAWSLRFDDPRELLDLDLSGLDDGRMPGGTSLTAPVYLACTHGSHDACCAEFGRTAAAALADVADDRAWECSHVGGDRFAANVVVLPHGVYHGRVTTVDAARIVALHDDGRTPIDTFRGRTRHPFVVQYAEAALRRHLAEERLDVIRPAGRHVRDGRVRRVPWTVGDRAYRVDVSVDRSSPARMTCRSSGEARAYAFSLVGIHAD